MKFNDLELTKKRDSKRVGRGISAGGGKTAGRGTKGQNSRAGGRLRPGFEGGQNPLYLRLPKLPGFKSHRPKIEVVYTGQLNKLGTNVDNFALFEAGLISGPHTKVKLIVKGDVTKKVNVKLQAASESAIAAVQKGGGSFEAVKQVGRSKKSEAKKHE